MKTQITDTGQTPLTKFLALSIFLTFFSVTTQESKDCSSDYDCEISQKCVKTGYDFRGICVDVTDSYGNKSFQYRPNPKSIGGNDGRGDCRYDSNCNIGFVCYKANPYDALGYCLRK